MGSLQSIKFGFEGALFAEELLQGLYHIWSIVEKSFYLLERVLLFVEESLCISCGNGFDTTYSGSNRTFGHNTESPNHTRRGNVSTPTQFDRSTILHNAYFFAIFLSKESHSPHSTSLGNRYITMLFSRIIGTYCLGY